MSKIITGYTGHYLCHSSQGFDDGINICSPPLPFFFQSQLILFSNDKHFMHPNSSSIFWNPDTDMTGNITQRASGCSINSEKNFSCFSESARHGSHIGRSENMAAVVRLLPSIRPQMASLTPPLLIFQRALRGHHLEKKKKNSRGKKKRWGGRVLFFFFFFFLKRGGRRGWLKSLPNILLTVGFQTHHLERWAGDVVQVHTSGEWVSSLVNIVCLKFSDTRSPLPYPSLVNAVLPLHTPPPYLYPSLLSLPRRPSLPFRVLRPESNLQQLSKSGMTDKLIFSSWVYIPGIWAADLAPNKRRVSASCLLKLMFSWPEMNYPVTRIYLYSS